MKKKIYKLSDYQNIFFDLNNKSIIQTKGWQGNEPIEEIVGYESVIRKGSFLSKNAKEYLLHITWNSCSFFGHVDNFGPLNQFIIFDDNYNQISDVFYQNAISVFVDIVDIDNTGINELIMESGYCGQGFCENFISIYYKNYTESLLTYVSKMECLNDFVKEYKERDVRSAEGRGLCMVIRA